MKLIIDAKCNDSCVIEVKDEWGREVLFHDGYVPDGLGIGGGDYISLEIDTETGFVSDWRPLTAKQLENSIKNED